MPNINDHMPNTPRTAFTPSRATLIYDEARSVNPTDADGNMIIVGENLEALKCLLSAYRERIKCIYIDPPYNTGNDKVFHLSNMSLFNLFIFI